MNDTIQHMLDEVEIPRMTRIRQRFDSQEIETPWDEIRFQMEQDWVRSALRGKKTVGITVGSRGICHLPTIVKSIVESLKESGIEPFVVPSMGSHGGATAEGQAEVVRELGFSEEYTGAKILSGTEVRLLGVTDSGLKVFYDSKALTLDGIIVLGRVKAHTDLEGDVESGIQKMIAIGLGDQKGAQVVHAAGLDWAVPRLKDIASYCLDHANIIMGIAVIENAYDRTCHIECIPREKIREREPELLAYSKTKLPKFHFNDIDVLIVDYIGKNISGDGMDPNVIGRSMIGFKNREIRINQIAALALTPETMTSALGVGLADVTTERIYRKMDLDIMYTNAITALALKGAHIPIVMNNDRNAIRLAMLASAVHDRSIHSLRVVRIRDTLHLGEIQVSPAILEEVRNLPVTEVLSEPETLQFDAAGNLIDL
ncbi:MAG: DUF362 domain-containing protein [Clostridia bacterium]|nr:DUF362 domain-containing protein [Clostridia bacterium]MBQ6427112.1 DUF362 domain-containing protein [Clostridia bacterium]